MRFWKNTKWTQFCCFLPAAILAGLTAVSLYGYTEPVFIPEQMDDTVASAVQTTDADNEETVKSTAVNTKAVPSVIPLSEASDGYQDGTYTGTGTGFSGPITVQVVITNGKIKEITILSTTDDSPYIENAAALLKTIVATQSTNVDTVSGATYSSVGLISAVRDALQKAGGSRDSDTALPTLAAQSGSASSEVPSIFAVSEPSAYRDGVYTGTGSGIPLVWSTFLTVFLSLCAFTIVFGRFFCGYACAFGTLGDAVRSLYVWICKKCRKKPITLKVGKKPFYLIKYLILLLIVIFCFTGIYSTWKGWSPWDVFSMLRAGNWHLNGDWVEIVLLLAIVVGMAFCERFFCRFLCPLGAIFSLLPRLPVFSVRRKQENCSKGCAACQRCCPAELTLPEAGSGTISGECFQCQKCVNICPKKNAHSGFGVVQGNTVWFTILQAGILAVVLILAGV